VTHHHQIGLEARDKHQEQDAHLRQIADEIQERCSGRSGDGGKHRPREDVQERRTKQNADENLAKHRRLM
jgi:hypothetical protein